MTILKEVSVLLTKKFIYDRMTLPHKLNKFLAQMIGEVYPFYFLVKDVCSVLVCFALIVQKYGIQFVW